MKLSEAIRLGSILKPQHFGNLWNMDRTASCALGAASDAVGNPRTLPLGWTEILLCPAICPVLACNTKIPPRKHVNGVIGHLNDSHKWTRESIADWLEVQEGRLAQEPKTETVPEAEPKPEPKLVGV